MWKNKNQRPTSHYSILQLQESNGMPELRKQFPDAQSNALNFVLFSTSGVHGNYTTIEEVERKVKKGETDEITFVIVQPRTITMKYGLCTPQTMEDIDFLKSLRESSHKAVAEIGL